MLREFYKDLTKEQQNSLGTSLNTSENADEARYVERIDMELFQNLTASLIID